MIGSGFALGFRLGLPICMSFLVFGVAFGIAAADKGLTTVSASIASALVFSGSSQFLLLGSVSRGEALPTISIAMFLLNVRYIIMGATLLASAASMPTWRRILGLIMMIDETWAVGMSPTASGDRLGAVMGCGVVSMLGWVAGTIIGATLGDLIGDPNRWGINFVYYSVFIFILASMWRQDKSLFPWIVAVAVALVVQAAIPGKWYVVIGGVAGALAGGLRSSNRVAST